jgi:hypothetical protein
LEERLAKGDLRFDAKIVSTSNGVLLKRSDPPTLKALVCGGKGENINGR